MTSAADPDRYRPDLADSLTNLGITLSALGLKPERGAGGAALIPAGHGPAVSKSAAAEGRDGR
jgi:hypothetical protein